jgi:ureidoglycolate dehydrogenase (NAD+)
MEMIDDGELDPRAVPALKELGPSLVMLQGARAAGAVTMNLMAAEAESRARATGCCIGIVGQTTHTGAIGQYAERLARAGLASILTSAGPPMMAYHGARIPSVSTSPIAIGIPRRGEPLFLDMATAVAALGRIKQSREGSGPLPEGMALDASGSPTTDPAKAAIAMPLGGAKGSGLALMFECLASLMAGVPILSQAIGPQGDGRHRQNALVIAIDVAKVCDLGTYQNEVERLAQTLKALPRREGFDEILLPGERGSRTSQARRKSGVPVSAATWKELAAVAAKYGVPMPA